MMDGATVPTPRTEPAGIRFEEVSVAYGASTVLDRFDLEVRRGEVMALLGPSGSGKTTALRAVAGFVRPSRGRVHLAGRDVTGLAPHLRGAGMVVQSYALFPHMRVEQNVAFGLKARKAPRREIPGRVAEALEMTGMGGYAGRYPRELSGGQQQRVALARALAIRPDVLLLDEPLSALDAQLRSGMLAELARLHRELPGVTMLYVTHDQVEALTLADRIAVLKDARLVDCGTPAELYRTPRTAFTASFVGGANLLPARASADGGALFAGARLRAAQDAPQGPVTLCVRPHLVALGGDGANELRGRLLTAQWRGSVHRLFVDVDGHEVRADVAELRDPPRPGEEVRLAFSPEDTVLLPGGDAGAHGAPAAPDPRPAAGTGGADATAEARTPAEVAGG